MRKFFSPFWNGLSATISPYDLAGLADAVERLIVWLDCGPAVVVGHSMGGMVAQELLARAPQAVAMAVLASTSPAFGKPGGDWQRDFLQSRFAPLDAGLGMAGLAGPLVSAMVAPEMSAARRAVAQAMMSGVPEATYRSAVAALAVLMAKPLDIPRQEHIEAHSRNKRLIDLLRMPNMRRVFIVSGALSTSWDLFTFVVPIHGSRIGLSASQIGLLLGAFGIAVFVVRLLLPLFVHRTTEWQMLIFAMVVTGTGFILFPLVNTVPVLMLISFILGIGFGGAQPVIMSLLYTHAPPGRGGEAVAVRTLLINFSQAGMPLLFGALGAVLGMTPVFWTMGAVLAGSAWVLRKS